MVRNGRLLSRHSDRFHVCFDVCASIKALSRLGLFCTADTPVDHALPLHTADIPDDVTPCGK
jgi:hypothetical protein